MMDAELIRQSLDTRVLGKKIYSFQTIDSTNTFARTLGENESPHGTLIVAEEQTAGRGRQGRRWQSQSGENLLFSVLFRTPFIQERARILPFVGALSVADAVEKRARCAVECKWPNDLLIHKKKFAGMLIEAVIQNEEVTCVIMGIGVNVNQTEFSDDIKDRTTSLLADAGERIDRIPLLCGILEELEHRLDQLRQFSPQGILDEWKRRTAMFGTIITLAEQKGQTSARAIDVAPNGALVVENEFGVRREVFAGDVTLS
jgi:BirA family transcriptional regulator, biotin operon repressor / biotin---[acetyl-CoA-carboxylase] ligase